MDPKAGRAERGAPFAGRRVLLVDDEVTGVLAVAQPAARDIAGAWQKMVGALADQAAVALQGTRLHREMGERLRDTETVLAVSQATGATLDLSEVLRRALREMTRGLGADMGGAWLLSPAGDRYLPLVG